MGYPGSWSRPGPWVSSHLPVPSPLPSASSPAAAAFAEEYAAAIHELRGSLERCLRATKADPTRPQELARRFDLNKNLAWKLSRLIREQDPAAALRFVPGSSGLRIAFDALRPHAPEQVAAAEEAAAGFGAMQARHAGDRATLEMMIAGLAHERLEPESLEQARRQAFLGNASIWGVQVRTQFSAMIVAPCATDADRVDIVLLAGLVDFRRTRPDAHWTLATRYAYTSDEGGVHPPQNVPLTEPPLGEGTAPLLEEFCSKPLPPVTESRSPQELRYELPGGDVGNSSLSTIVYGVRESATGSRIAEEPGERAELGTNLLTPAEHAQIDLLLHKDLGWHETPSFHVYSRLHGQGPTAGSTLRGYELPTSERPIHLGRGSAGLTSARVPRCAELITRGIELAGWSVGDFDIWRVSLSFPPIPSTGLISVPLPNK